MRPAAILVLFLAGCLSTPASHEEPASIVNANAESHAEIVKFVRAVLYDVPMQLAGDVLTETHILLIERTQRLDPRGLPVDGRQQEVADRFLLTIDGKRCVLTHERTRQRAVLKSTQCKAR
ncbi:MAG TPA: hypothetical protein VK629_02645 [Steroidobacteraceae bacterium]|nr:hypothetical protein [Steroidobacteraceae bacterium]